MESDRLVDDYLRRLEAAAAHLQRSRRAELVAEIREHIEAALREEDAANEVAVRNVLERLGRPDEIVDAAEPLPGRAKVGGVEIGALFALLVPLGGWLVGVVLVLVSKVWSPRDKAIGVALATLALALPFVGFMAGGSGESGMTRSAIVEAGEEPITPDTTSGEGTGAGELALGLLLFLGGGLPSAIYLGWRLHRPQH